MNILVLSWRDIKHPRAGGAEQVVHEHAKGWVGAGNSVTHFSSRFEGSVKEENIDGVEFIRGGYEYLGVQLSAFVYYLANRQKFDLVVDEFHGIPFFTPIYVRKPRLAVVQETARNVWFLNPLPVPINWIIGLIGFLGEPFIFLLYRSTQFMTGSQSAKLDVSKFWIPINNITVVPHGVILEMPKVKVKKELTETLIYLGVISPDKGIEDAIKCFSLLKGKNYQFWVVGRDETKEFGRKMRNLANKLGLKELRFWGFVSQEEKFKLLSKAHVLINPSVREGWGLVNIEANSAGTPVIAYESPGLIDSVSNGESGIICDDNPKAMAEAVTNVFGNHALYEKLCSGAERWSKNFDWKISVKKSLELINSVSKG
jgi:glycosyltransferase involved in cell wall biosynthesis